MFVFMLCVLYQRRVGVVCKLLCVQALIGLPVPRLASNNEDSTFNNLDRQIKKMIQ